MKILPNGSWVGAKDTGPFSPPFKPRFGLNWTPEHDIEEDHRQALLRDVRAYCAQVLGPRKPNDT